MQQHRLPFEPAPAPATAEAWYRQPVLWLGAAILAASLAGCVWMVVLGSRHADVQLQDAHPHTLLDMPVQRSGNGDRGTANGKAAREGAPGAIGPEHSP